MATGRKYEYNYLVCTGERDGETFNPVILWGGEASARIYISQRWLDHLPCEVKELTPELRLFQDHNLLDGERVWTVTTWHPDADVREIRIYRKRVNR